MVLNPIIHKLISLNDLQSILCGNSFLENKTQSFLESWVINLLEWGWGGEEEGRTDQSIWQDIF